MTQSVVCLSILEPIVRRIEAEPWLMLSPEVSDKKLSEKVLCCFGFSK